MNLFNYIAVVFLRNSTFLNKMEKTTVERHDMNAISRLQSTNVFTFHHILSLNSVYNLSIIYPHSTT